MLEQSNINIPVCENCIMVQDNSILVSVQVDNKWSLLLCPKKVKNKLLKLGCPQTEIGSAYKRFVENFGHFPVCPKGELIEEEV